MYCTFAVLQRSNQTKFNDMKKEVYYNCHICCEEYHESESEWDVLCGECSEI